MTRFSYMVWAAILMSVVGASTVRATKIGSPAATPAAPQDTKGTFAAQATRGKDAYEQQCSVCHQSDLSGSDMVPALAGSAFMARWEGKTAKDLFDRISTTMPSNAPGSLEAPMYLDLVAYILQVNDITLADPVSADSLPKVVIQSK